MDDPVLDYPFCKKLMVTNSMTSCTYDGSSVGSCNLVQFGQDLAPIYQNFDILDGVDAKDIGKVGGSVTLADFCPYIQEFTWKSDSSSGGKATRGTRCTDQSNQPNGDRNYALEEYGSRSLCIEQGGAWQQRSCTMLKQWQRYGAGTPILNT
jgi:leishmanolysin-like peptidase